MLSSTIRKVATKTLYGCGVFVFVSSILFFVKLECFSFFLFIIVFFLLFLDWACCDQLCLWLDHAMSFISSSDIPLSIWPPRIAFVLLLLHHLIVDYWTSWTTCERETSKIRGTSCISWITRLPRGTINWWYSQRCQRVSPFKAWYLSYCVQSCDWWKIPV